MIYRIFSGNNFITATCLISCGASVNAVHNQSPLIAAIETDVLWGLMTVRLLLKEGADVNEVLMV